MDILQSLNLKQRQAVTAVSGPVLVIAGPGAGKTRCLTHRLAYLIQQGIAPSNILAVTFTNKAAQEMRQRVKKLLTPGFKTLSTIGTFHSVCLQILRKEIEKFPQSDWAAGYRKTFIIYDQTDQLNLIKKIIRDLEISEDQFKPAHVLTTISRAKDELIDQIQYQKEASEYFPQNIAKIYSAYQARLKKANALDFDDLIMLTVRLFQKNQEILGKYQKHWQYILVDEAHDNNFAQYQLTNLLAQKTKNLWCIADVDQSIYGWRGADFRNILNFEKDYASAQVIFLEQNYRSSQNILEAAHQIIIQNKQRKEKNLWTKNDPGEPIYLIQTNNEEEEGNFLIEEIEGLASQGFSLKDLTVLYRTNAQSRSVEEAFLKAGLPYKIIGAIRFYERKEIKDILAYLKLIHNPHDLLSLSRIINTPPRRLARYTSLKNIPQDPACQSFSNLIDSFRQKAKLALPQLIQLVIEKIDYETYIRNRATSEEEGQRRWENIGELLTVAAKYEKDKNGLAKFLAETALLSAQDEVETNKELINLMTLHCAKGLEFPIVFIVGLEEGILPHAKSSFDPGNMEEERRLCYVGITRAKQKLYLTFTRQRRLYGQVMANLPSRFLSDIPEKIIEFREYF